MDEVNTAIILAGGKGERLRSIGANMDSMPPKPMTKIAGKPILEHAIQWLKRNNVKNIIIGVAYKKEQIIDYFGSGEKFGVNIKYSEHDVEDGTGDAFRKAIENTNLTDSHFYAMNGDQFTDFSLETMLKAHTDEGGSLATILLIRPFSPYGMVEFDESMKIKSFREKPRLSTWTNSGIYLFDIRIKPYLEGDVEKVAFERLSKEKKLMSVAYDGFWDTITTQKDIKRISELVEKGVIK